MSHEKAMKHMEKAKHHHEKAKEYMEKAKKHDGKMSHVSKKRIDSHTKKKK